MAHPNQVKKRYHLGMLNGKTPYIVSLCLLIIAAVAIYGMVEHMGVADILALLAGLTTALGALSWVYTRAGQGNASNPTKTEGNDDKPAPPTTTTEGGVKSDV